jgi:hypothetical protein
MASLAHKKTLLHILWEQYTPSLLQEGFEVVKYLFGRFAKKIYTSEFTPIFASLPPAVATIVTVLWKFDVCDTKGLQAYISLLKKQNTGNIDLLQVVEENSSVAYTKGDAMYKRSLGRDLEKLLK